MTLALRPVICALFSAVLAGCAFNGATISSPLAGLDCIDDSFECVAKRKATLDYLTGDPTRSWVRQRPTPAGYASGVRLFAFKRLKSKLTCAELKVASKEADAAPEVLRSAQAKSLSPAQVSRGKLLATEVSHEMHGELKRRCKNKA
jgi:hypothetical protein